MPPCMSIVIAVVTAVNRKQLKMKTRETLPVFLIVYRHVETGLLF